MTAFDAKRRDFLVKVAQGSALAVTGGLVWSYLITRQAGAAPGALRPPGAGDEADFAALCIKCGSCVTACPYDTLRLATAGADAPPGTPYFRAREVPCYMCPDIPCKAACPTGALDPALENIGEARMGLAVIDRENCLSWQGLRCEVCYRECPVIGKAISTELHPRKLSRHGVFVPVVHSEYCTGCGVCEKACPTQEASIRVLPPELVQGEIGEHYRLGWKSDTPITQEFESGEGHDEVPVVAPGMNYLNEGEL